MDNELVMMQINAIFIWNLNSVPLAFEFAFDWLFLDLGRLSTF